jgi:hypothetical protein
MMSLSGLVRGYLCKRELTDELVRVAANSLESRFRAEDERCRVTFQKLENFYEVVVYHLQHAYAVALDIHQAEKLKNEGLYALDEHLLDRLKGVGLQISREVRV